MPRGRAYRSARDRVLDGATNCFWCGCWIAKDLPAQHPHKATADHVIPVKDGGPDTIENLVPACFKCNTERGAKGVNWKPGPDLPGTEDW